MAEMRWNPLLREWVVTASHRMNRTFKPPKEYCPLCPTKPGAFPTEVPAPDYEIVVFENRFPSFRENPGQPDVDGTGLCPVEKAQGLCEVVLYSSRHEGTLADESLEHIQNLIRVWQDRYRELGAKDFIDYVLIFENKGDVIGVTLSHPHGQIYAFPFIPPIPARELESARLHRQEHGTCLICDLLTEEELDGRRVIASNRDFLAVVPFYARYPYEVHLTPRRHMASILELTEEEISGFAQVLKEVILRYDGLWGFPLPYMMIMHQAPTDGRDYGFYHWHVEFYPLHRAQDKLKYRASVESGAGTFIIAAAAEDMAAQLRKVSLKEGDLR